MELGPYGAGTSHVFGAVLSCIGFGQENCSAGAYRGLAFWESDDLEKTNCGFAYPPKILISGGGDGALQDFIRAVTSRSTKAAFNGVLRAFARFPWVFDSIQSEIQSAEDIASRALSWNLAQHDDAIFRRLEDAHMAVIHRLRASHAWPAVAAAVRSMVPAQIPQINLIHRKPHFTRCYALNRFLTLLILDVLGRTSVVRQPATKVVAVGGIHPHVCAGVASACKGHAHAVTLETGGVPVTSTFDLVILRHGILGPKNLLPGRRTANLRQLLPYYVDV